MERKLKPLGEQEIVFDDDPTVFGRSDDADVQIDDPSMSNFHCAIRLWDKVLIILDLGSTNGTFVNDKKVEPVAVIKPGDKVRMGNVVFEI